MANFLLIKVVNRTAPLDIASAAHTNAIRIESISYMTGYAISIAVATMVGQSLGSKDPRRAGRSAYLGYAVGGGFMALMGLGFIFFAQIPASLLAVDPSVRELTARCLRITGFCQAGFAASIIFGGALRGAGDTVMVMLLVTASVVLIRGGGVYIMGQYHQPLWMIWIILASDLFVRGILVYGRFLQGGWKKIRV
jgi:Na+-driven multidrug efflux pump